MKFPILLAAAVLAAAPLAVVRAEAQVPGERAATLDSIRALLPVGTFTVDVMDVVSSPRITELNQRLQAAMQANPAWFQQAVSRATPGEPLPYDARLGLTESEYREFLRLGKEIGLDKVAEAPLTVRAEGARLVLDGGAGFPDLTGISIDLAADEVTTPLGVVRGSIQMHSTGGAAGSWDGRQWSLEEGSAESGNAKMVELSLGRLRESGRGLFYWQLREIRDGQPVQRMVRILYFDPPR